MEKFERRLDKIMKKYDLDRFSDWPYEPYLIMRKRAQKRAFFLIELLKQNSNVSICIIVDNAGYKRLHEKLKGVFYVNVTDMWKHSEYELKRYFIELFSRKSTPDYIIGMANYRQNQHVGMVIAGMEMPLKYIDIYEYLDEHEVHTCRSDLFLRKKISLKSFLLNIHQLLTYYGYHIIFLQNILNLTHYFPFYARREDILAEWQLTRLIYEKSLYFSEQYSYKRLIALYCELRDFKNLLELIDRTKEKGGYEWVKDFETDIRMLFSELKQKIRERIGKTVIFNWVDAISYLNLKDMPWLCSLKEQSINFANTYTMMPWTSITFKVMLTGKHPMRDKLFRLGKIGSGGEYPIYDAIEQNGYKIWYVGVRSKGAIHFQKKSRYVYSRYHALFPCTEKQWEALTLLAENPKQNLFLFIHNVNEGHQPFFNIQYNDILELWMPDFPEKQKVSARKYLDDQIQWYQSFYGNATEIYMSDHGEEYCGKMNYQEERSHVLFMIKEGKKKEESKFLSMKNVGKVILRLLNSEDYSDLMEEKIYMEVYDTYNKQQVKKMLLNHALNEKWMQFQAIRTKNDLYVLYADGTEKYFRLPDEEHELSNNEEYKMRIKVLREELIPYFINPYKERYFRWTRKLYDSIGGSLQ